MFYFSQEEWIEINRVFLTAFEQFWNEGTELQIIELNHKSIEISFSRQVRLSPHRFHVEIYRRDVDELLETSFDPRTDDTKEIIQMLFQLAWLTKLPYYFRMTAKKNLSRSEKFCSMCIMTVIRRSAQRIHPNRVLSNT